MSRARRRGLIRLAALLAAVLGLIVLIAKWGGSSGGSPSGVAAGDSTGSTFTVPAGSASTQASPAGVLARISPQRLPAPLSGEALVSQPNGLLIIGGVDGSDTSISGVFEFDPSTGKLARSGSLAQPLHDAAAATLSGQVLVFGGGSTTTTDSVESLRPGHTGRVVGRMPTASSDLSAVTVDSSAYVLGGYNGQSTVGSVLQTSDGRHFATVAQLPSAVRYPAVVALGHTIYAFGGELASGQDSTDVQAIDVANRRATLIGHLPQPVAHASAVVLGGAIYLLGGRRNGSASDQILRFDPSNGGFIAAGHLPMPVTNAAVATLGETAYLIGGLDADGASLDSAITVR